MRVNKRIELLEQLEKQVKELTLAHDLLVTKFDELETSINSLDEKPAKEETKEVKKPVAKKEGK